MFNARQQLLDSSLHGRIWVEILYFLYNKKISLHTWNNVILEIDCIHQSIRKDNLFLLYEKYSDIFDNYRDDKKKSEIKNDEFCIIIELIGRIEKEYGIQYNYDEYMLQIYKF